MEPEKKRLLKGHRVLPLAREFLDKIDFSLAPSISWPGDVDRNELKSALGVQELVSFVLPIGEVDAESGNGFTYKEPSILGLVRQVNQIRPEGFWGHLRDDEIGTKYGPPAVRWLAAELDDGGIAWGLGVALTEDAGKHFKSAKALRAKTGTSIFGWNVVLGEDFDVYGYDLVSIDLASSERVGVPVTSAHPSVSTEMQGDNEVDPKKKDGDNNTTPPTTPSPPVDNNQNMLKEMEDLRRQVSILRMVETDFRIAQELLGLDKDDDLAQGIRELQRERDNYAAENRTLLESYITDQLVEAVKFENARPIVRSLVMAENPSTTAEVKTVITKVMSSDAVKVLLESQREEDGGPPMGTENNHQDKTDDPDKKESQYLEPKPETV